MSEWNRSTRACTVESLPKSIVLSIQEHLQKYNLGSITNNYIDCVETFSEKKKKGLFSGRGNKWIRQYIILTPEWLIWATSGERSGEAVSSAQIKDLQVRDFSEIPEFQILKDTGIYLTGIFTGQVGMHGDQHVSGFLGLGEETAAKQFKERLMQVYQASRKK